MGIVVFGAVFVDVKGYPLAKYIPGGRNVGRVVQTHGGVSRNIAEDIANVELRPTFVSVVDETGAGTDVYEAVKNLKIGDTVDLEGFCFWFDGLTPHITGVTRK